jgi:hypothetical protein
MEIEGSLEPVHKDLIYAYPEAVELSYFVFLKGHF